MTPRELDELLAGLELAAPVTSDDLREVKRRVDERKAVGTWSEVILRGDRVEVAVGHGRTPECYRTSVLVAT